MAKRMIKEDFGVVKYFKIKIRYELRISTADLVYNFPCDGKLQNSEELGFRFVF